MSTDIKRDFSTATLIRKRSIQLRRIMAICDIIKFHYAPTYREIQRDLREEHDIDVCHRTIRRDLAALIELNQVEEIRGLDDLRRFRRRKASWRMP